MNLEGLDALYLGGYEIILGHREMTPCEVKLSHCHSNGNEALGQLVATTIALWLFTSITFTIPPLQFPMSELSAFVYLGCISAEKWYMHRLMGK